MAAGIVVLVEDNELVKDVLSSMLSESGYHVLAFADAAQALLAAPLDQPAVLVTDYRLSGTIDGLTLAESWECSSTLRRAVVISGAAEPLLTARPVLRKPFTLAALAAAVAQKFQELAG